MKKVAFDVFYLFISSFDCGGGGSGCSTSATDCILITT